MIKLSDFDYQLPPDLIAQKPISPRDLSRLLVFDRSNQKIKHQHFYDLSDLLNPGDLLVVNDSKVFKARLSGQKEKNGGRVEVFLLKSLDDHRYIVIGRNLKVGERIIFEKSKLIGEISEYQNRGFIVSFNFSGNKLSNEINQIGKIPLPPYIKRKTVADDLDWYQTVYAKNIGSVAAPTAGLHFTDELLEKIKKRGVKIAKVTLHVGLGTFLPVKVDDISKHQMHSETFEIKNQVIEEIIKTKKNGGRVIAVGTTTCRVLETVFGSKIPRYKIQDTPLRPLSFEGQANKYQIPNQEIQNLTNYKSSLVCHSCPSFVIPAKATLSVAKAGIQSFGINSGLRRAQSSRGNPEKLNLDPRFLQRRAGGSGMTQNTEMIKTIPNSSNLRPKADQPLAEEPITYCGETDIFIYPPYEFRVVDGLVTNFHLPKSTLLMLASAFAGRELVMKAYQEAIKENYRFYSYGDAMLIL